MTDERTAAQAQWMNDGACASGQYDRDLWFPEWGDTGAAAKAKRICNQDCPVRDKCAEYAVTFPVDLLGVWGGMSRKEIRRERISRGVKSLSESDLSLLNTAVRDAYGDDDTGS